MPNWFTTHIAPGIRTLDDRIHGLDTLKRRIKTLQYNKTVNVLDIGSAEGLISDWLLDGNGKIVGLDVDADKIKTAQLTFHHKPYDFSIANADDLPKFQPKQFDVVLLLAILQKLNNPLKCLFESIEFASTFFAIRVPPYWYEEYWTQEVQDRIQLEWQLVYRIDEESNHLMVFQRLDTIDQLEQVRKEIKQRVKLHSVNTADINVVSFPKSGRTWIRHFLAAWLDQQYSIGMDLEFMPQHYWSEQRKALKFPYVNFTHDFFDLHQETTEPVSMLYQYPKPTVFLLRNPFDTIVSYYYQKVKREGIEYVGTIDDFVLDPVFGLNRSCEWQLIALDSIKKQRHHIITYENMSVDMHGEMCKFMDFLGVKYTPESIQTAVSLSEFDKMQQIEVAGTESATAVGRLSIPNWDGDIDKLKVRSGKVNSWNHYLKQETVDALNQQPYVSDFLKFVGKEYPASFPT